MSQDDRILGGGSGSAAGFSQVSIQPSTSTLTNATAATATTTTTPETTTSGSAAAASTAAAAALNTSSSSLSGCPSRDSDSSITLAIPRPEHQRSTNLYVDTPFKHRVQQQLRRPAGNHGIGATQSQRSDIPMVHGAPARGSSNKRTVKPQTQKQSSKPSISNTSISTASPSATSTLKSNNTSIRSLSTSTATLTPATTTFTSSITSTSVNSDFVDNFGGDIILKQPTALTFTKGWNREESEGSSIICSWCGKCRCEACSTPRPLPATWLCGNRCLCSPSTTVDYLSCLCCVKGVLYHCSRDHESSLIDRPYSCSGPDRCLRWTCLTASTVPLPCLICYWPMTGVRRLIEMTYQRCTTHGCRCTHTLSPMNRPPQIPPPPEKRLLQDCA